MRPVPDFSDLQAGSTPATEGHSIGPDRLRTAEAAPLLSVVVPCFNEEKALPIFLAELFPVLDDLGEEFEVVLVDDGSTDGTFKIVSECAQQRPEVCGIRFSRNFGHQAALTAGIDAARGQAVVTMDADLQHPPSLIPMLLNKWRAGAAVVLTERQDPDDIGAFKRHTSRLYYRIFSRIASVPLARGSSDFRLIDARVAQVFRQCREAHRMLRGLALWAGFEREIVPFRANARAGGRSAYTMTRMLRLAFDGIFSFSIAPLRAAMFVGFLLSAFAALYLVFAVSAWMFIPRIVVPGWTSILSSVLLLGGVQLLFLGLL